MKHCLKKALALALLPLLVAGCAQEAGEMDDEGLLPAQSAAASSQREAETAALPARLALPYYPGESLDPVDCSDGVQQTVAALLCEGLFALDRSLVPQPQLCASYTADPAGLVYTFTLRPDVQFSDGTALTAADVAATLSRARASARYGARLAGVSAVKAENGGVVVTLSAPNTGLPALLDIPVVKTGSQAGAPVGTGPYRLEQGGGGGLTLVSNPFWWQGRQPVDRIALEGADSPDAMLYQFTSHETQLLAADLTGTDPVSVTGSIVFQDADTPILHFLGVNTARAPLDNPAVRRALSLGIDREQLVSAFLSGHGRAAQFPICPVSPDYPADLDQPYSYDAFRQAMEALGLNSGQTRTLKLLVNEENAFKVSAAAAVAAALSAFDLKIEVQVLPWAEYTAALNAGSFDLYYGEVKLTADWDLRLLAGAGGSLNQGGFSDPVLDGQLAALGASENRAAALRTICRRLQTQAPLLPICFKTTSVLMQDGVIENLTPTAANPLYGLSDCTVHLSGAS